MGAKRVIWHVGFERNLRRRGPPSFEVRSEVPLSEEPPRLDYLLLRKLTPEASPSTIAHRHCGTCGRSCLACRWSNTRALAIPIGPVSSIVCGDTCIPTSPISAPCRATAPMERCSRRPRAGRRCASARISAPYWSLLGAPPASTLTSQRWASPGTTWAAATCGCAPACSRCSSSSSTSPVPRRATICYTRSVTGRSDHPRLAGSGWSW